MNSHFNTCSNFDYVYCTLTEVFLNLTEVFLTRTEVVPCFFLSCKANARVKLAKMGHGPQSSTLVCICVVRLLFVLFYVLFLCKCVLPPGDNPTAVNKYMKTLPTIWRNQIRNRVTDSMTTKVINLLLPGAYFIYQQINNHHDKQCAHKHNIEVHSCKHFCSRKPITIN